VLPNGWVQVSFPWWFNVEKENIRLSFLTDLKNLKCMDLTLADPVATACTFDAKTQTLTLPMIIGPSGKKGNTVLQFTLSSVLNPISTDITPTLTVRTTDSKGGVTDQATVIFQAMLPNQVQNP